MSLRISLHTQGDNTIYYKTIRRKHIIVNEYLCMRTHYIIYTHGRTKLYCLRSSINCTNETCFTHTLHTFQGVLLPSLQEMWNIVCRIQSMHTCVSVCVRVVCVYVCVCCVCVYVCMCVWCVRVDACIHVHMFSHVQYLYIEIKE